MTAPAHLPSATAVHLGSTRERATRRPTFAPSRKRSGVRVVAVVVAVGLAVAGAALALRPTAVTTATVARGTAIEAVYATGTVEPFDRAVVKARAAGAVDLKVREGAHVRKGDLLALIETPSLKSDLARGRADMWAASQHAGTDGPQLAVLEAQSRALRADLNTAQHDRDRVEKLVGSGASPRAELDRLVDRAAALEAQLAANLAQQRALRIDLKARAWGTSAAVDSLAARLADTEVRSPIDGVVLARFVEPGEIAMVNAPLVKIGAADNLILECAVDEADIGRVALGKRVAVSLYAFRQSVYRGEVFEVLPDADRVRKSFLVKVRLTEPPAGLRSGMTAEVNIIIDEKPDALLVPADAVDASGAVAVASGGRLRRRVPELGIRDMLRIEVTGGLAEGDEVVVTGAAHLADDARVRATLRPAPTGEATSGAARSRMSL